jgi:hypothetical protein
VTETLEKSVTRMVKEIKTIEIDTPTLFVTHRKEKLV